MSNPGARPSRSSGARRIYPVLVTVGALLLFGWTVAVTVSVSFQEMLPGISVKTGAADARALGNLAEQTAAAGSLSDAAQLARAAVRKDPTVVDAFRILGLAAAQRGDDDAAAELFAHADRLSRRDVGSQLWLLQHYGRRADGLAALRHLDAAMASDVHIRGQLLPLLVAGLQDPQIVEPLAIALGRHPDWGPALLDAAATNGTDLGNVDRLFALADSRGAEISMRAWQRLVKHLADAGRYSAAADHYARATGRRPGPGVNDGGFDQPGGIPPFDWRYGSGDDYEAAPAPAPAGRSGAAVAFRHGDTPPEILLRQLLLLQPGKHQLSGLGLIEQLDRANPPTWSVICAEGGETIGRSSPIDSVGRWRPFTFEFQVPAEAGCRAQWLELHPASVTIDARVAGYYDDLNVHRN